MPLSPDALKDLLAKLDDMIRQAKEFQDQIRRAMTDRARRDLQDRRGQPERRAKARKR